MYRPCNLQKKEEKCFQISFNPHQHIIPDQDLFFQPHHVLLHNNSSNNYGVKDEDLDNIGSKKKKKKKKLLLLDTNLDDFDGHHVSDQIKLMHRERERQRRQQMASLYMSLRTLLPLEFIKGKRAISDQMNGAVNYIKHQKRKIKEIELKRDELKKLYHSNSNNNLEKSRSEQLTPSCSFKIRCFDGGLEIFITTKSFHGFPLSRILKVVVEQELEIISCGSSIINDKSIHTIQIEVSDSTSLDLAQLGNKLIEAVPLLRQVLD